ncbi:hypothetical protein GQ53DRAFT_670741 [Thozetella sp. PMI_491]|nr:hypothetical protein GQ53DRAFT_670741 [Thozetella sp. PMI_491]
MGNFGRYVCVAIPFLMTLASLAALLAAGLGGVADKSMFMFQANTTNLTISAADVSDLLRLVTRTELAPPTGVIAARDSATTSTGVVTGQDLGIYNLYDIGMWGYCYTMQNGTRTCTQTAFNWAENALNQTTSNVDSLITATGKNVTLPKEVVDGIHAFQTAIKWTEIVFVIAAVALGVELFFGFLANCSRVFSCITWLVAGFATVAVCATAALATATSAIVVGVLEGSAKKYGVTASFNTRFLAVIWISAAFAIGAGMFWIFTCCCCAPDHHSRSRKRDSHSDREKLVPAGAYVPIHGDHSYNGAYGNQQHHYASGANNVGRRDVAYEPYAHHSNV